MQVKSHIFTYLEEKCTSHTFFINVACFGYIHQTDTEKEIDRMNRLPFVDREFS